MYLNRIEVRNFRLQGQDIIWDLQPDVNILVGYNGCGKTSLLKMIYELYRYDYNDIDITDKEILFKTIEQQKVDSITIFEGQEKEYQSFRTYKVIPYNTSLDTFTNEIQLINTFDVTLSHYKKIFSEMKDFPFESSLLDLSLDKIKIAFLLFNHRIRKDLEQLHFEPETLTAIERKEISDKIEKAAIRRKKFIKIIDRLFIETQKVLDIIDADFSFLDAEKNEILLTELSSGEKQLLFILLTVFIQNEEPSILLLDEPEISMHIYWLRELISIIREINPNCQLIIATHSPTIISQGWFDKTKNWEEVISPYYSQHSMIGYETEESAQKRNNFLQNTRLQNYHLYTHLHYLTYSEIIRYFLPLKIRDISYSTFIFEGLSKEQIAELIKNGLINFLEFERFISNSHNLQEAIELAVYLLENHENTSFGLDILWRKTTNNEERKQVIAFANDYKQNINELNLSRFKSLKPKNGKKT